MMKIQRTALVIYVTIELHKNILDVTLADAYHVWNDPENITAWKEASKRKDLRRGYKDYTTLYSVVKSLAQKHKLNIAKITAV